MLLEQRKAIILGELKKKNTCTIDELKGILQVSRSTLHRDLELLERSGEVSRVHGGVIFLDGPGGIPGLEIRIGKNRQEKEEIAKKAIKLIEKESCIFLDQSSTCLYLAREIIRSMDLRIAIVTNSIRIIAEVDARTSNIDVIATGGTLYHGWAALGGPACCKIFSDLNIDQVFMSCRGISIQRGPMTFQPFVKEVLNCAVEAAGEVNVLADSSKFGKVAAYSIMPIESVNHIISDRKLDSKIAEDYRNHGLEVVL